MSPNVRQSDSPAKKRSHEDFVNGEGDENAVFGKQLVQQPQQQTPAVALNGKPLISSGNENIPPTPSAPASTASPMASPFAAQQPPAKRKRLTDAEKQEKAQADAAKKAEREAAKAARDAEKEAAAKDAAARKLEREAEKEKKAQAEAAKKQERDEARAARDAEKAKKDEERAKKQKVKQEAQEAIEKEANKQKKLNSFFLKRGPSTPSKKPASLALVDTPSSKSTPNTTPSKEKDKELLSEYNKVFQPFFRKENVIVADICLVDEDGKEAKARILDEYMQQKRAPFQRKPWTPDTVTEYLDLPSRPRARGRRYHSVRKVMAMMDDYKNSTSGDQTTESQNAQIHTARDLLKSVPMKFLGFREDVRPPYFGTATNVPAGASLAKLARNPMCREVLPLNYDYDSEAEWFDDGEGEDIDGPDDDDEDLDDDEEMGEFLDDSDDAAPARTAFAAGLEPESTGLCWEDRNRLGPNAHMYKYRMEFILESLPHHNNIDPFSTEYWEPEKPSPSKAPKDALAPPRSLAEMMMPPPPPPSGSPNAPIASKSTFISPTDITRDKMSAEQVEDFKRAILKYGNLAKAGITAMLHSEFGYITNKMTKELFELMAEKVGAGRNKQWQLKHGYGLAGE